MKYTIRLIFIMDSWILMILVVMPGVWSGPWGVTLQNQCALQGTSIVIKCSYDYPFGHIVTSVQWRKVQSLRLIALDRLPSPPDFRYEGNYHSNCDLKIYNVQRTDEGRYYFSFVTTFDKWTSRTSVYLSIKALTTIVQPSTVTEGDNVTLTCVSECPTRTNIVWFRNGQPVPKPVFQARREDAGEYYCAVLGQERARSKFVALNVQYAPKRVALSVSPSGDITQGSSVTFTCSSEANPPVTPSGYSLYKDGQFINSGQSLTISDIQPSHSGLYLCQAWNNISWRGINVINSSDIHLDVWYQPTNFSVSLDPPQFAEGSSVNLTCSSVANPATVNYTWYKRVDDNSSSSMLLVGSGQVLSFPSMEESHTGLYLCQARNSLGESNSTEVLLTMTTKKPGSLLVLSGVGAFVFVALVIAFLLLWRKQRIHAEEKQTVVDSRHFGKDSSSSAREDQPDTLYANIHTLSPSPLHVSAAADLTSSSHHKYNVPTYRSEVMYSAVTIKPRNPSNQHYINNSRADCRSKAGESDTTVIYSTVAKSSLSRF